MMYSVDLTTFSLEEFEDLLLTVYLLPSQRIILKDLSLNMQKLKNEGLKNLQNVHDLLRNKNDHPAISEETGIDEAYLLVLNRMVNSYIVKVLPLEKLTVFTKEELRRLAEEGLKNTKHYYEAMLTPAQREKLSEKLNIPLNRLEYALHIIDLLRINGVGVEYAKILHEMGIQSVQDYNRTPSETILASFNELNRQKEYTKATLGISDIEYCRRFSTKLECDIR
ncbi:MAG: DUF4332 domain-containing protein [Methanomethylovorans sp.]|nr:DUF4332 domain-containing protein [Methanomethylovorans sp.]